MAHFPAPWPRWENSLHLCQDSATAPTHCSQVSSAVPGAEVQGCSWSGESTFPSRPINHSWDSSHTRGVWSVSNPPWVKHQAYRESKGNRELNGGVNSSRQVPGLKIPGPSSNKRVSNVGLEDLRAGQQKFVSVACYGSISPYVMPRKFISDNKQSPEWMFQRRTKTYPVWPAFHIQP